MYIFILFYNSLDIDWSKKLFCTPLRPHLSTISLHCSRLSHRFCYSISQLWISFSMGQPHSSRHVYGMQAKKDDLVEWRSHWTLVQVCSTLVLKTITMIYINIITTSEDIWQWKAPIWIAISAIYQVKKTTSLYRAWDPHLVFQVIFLSQERVQPKNKNAQRIGMSLFNLIFFTLLAYFYIIQIQHLKLLDVCICWSGDSQTWRYCLLGCTGLFLKPGITSKPIIQQL